MGRPPVVWSVKKSTSRSRTRATARATVLGDIVQLEVEEDAFVPRGERFDDGGALSGEELKPHLVEVGLVAEGVHQAHRFVEGRNV
jgi:hypothetical protein